MIKIYSLIIGLCLTYFLNSCQTKYQASDIEKYYLLYSSRGSSVDTLSYESVNKYPPATVDHNIIDSFHFVYNGTDINIKKISNFPDGPVDGGFVSYWEKNIGYFYGRSTTWRSFNVLKTNNDSINDFISVLLGAVLIDPQFSTNPGIDYENLLKLVTPSVLDTIK